MGSAKFLLATVVSLSLAAQPVYVATPKPISRDRLGPAAGRIPYDATIASNGESFLVSWSDDRFLSASLHSNQLLASSLFLRVGADGVPLDEHPMALPFPPTNIVWTGTEWLTAGNGQFVARISAEGKLLEIRKLAVENFYLEGLAWAGRARSARH